MSKYIKMPSLISYKWPIGQVMHKMTLLLTVTLLIGLTASIQAAIDDAPTFEHPEQYNQYNELINIVRCPTCQNQNIAESNAALARQLRQIIVTQIHQGQSNDDIIDYLVERYGDFITYDPPFKPITWLLWLGPTIMMLLALIYWFIFRRSTPQEKQQLTPAEREELHAIINKYK